MTTIIVEIPHQAPPTAWKSNSDQDIIRVADAEHGLVYNRWTLDKSIDCWGEDDIPKELLSLLKEHKEAVEIGNSSYTEYYTVKDVGTHVEVAKEAIAHDLSSCLFLTVDEAKAFTESYCGHQDIKARAACEKVLEDV